MTKEIPLTRNLVAIVDDEDYALVSGFSWHATKGTTNRTYYARTTGRGSHASRKVLYLHRLVLGLATAPRSVCVDHINGDTLDNRRANLRTTDAKGNSANRVGAKSQSGYKGVYPAGAYRWRARIAKGKGSCLGHFDTPEDAARAYDKEALRRFGEFARLNFPAPGQQGCVVTPPVPFDLDAFVEKGRERAKLYARHRRAANTSPSSRTAA